MRCSPPALRDISLPSTEMLVEDAEMRWSDFGHAPRDWEIVKRQLTEARVFAERLLAGEDTWKGRTGVFTKAYRSEVDGTCSRTRCTSRRPTTRRRPGR